MVWLVRPRINTILATTTDKRHRCGTLKLIRVRNRKKNNSGGRTTTDQNAEIGITKEDAMTTSTIAMTDVGKDTTEVGMNGTTPRIMTAGGTIDVIRNDKETGISDATKEEGIFAGKSVGKQLESTIRDQSQTPL